jgi:predicted AlkP superfamily pyrophosphatase or phosphodiesterase
VLARSAAALACLLLLRSPAAQTPPAVRTARTVRPALVVLLVVDQFRGDYVELYGSAWTHGLHRLFTEGAYFTRAAYPYGVTVTCAGHSTIGTGTVPATHGMVDNAGLDAATDAYTACTEDPAAAAVPFGGGRGTEHHSARWLRVPTLGDELGRQRPGSRVVAMSMKPRSAIGLAGHGGSNTTVVWQEDSGTWATSSAFGTRGAPYVDAFVRAHPIRPIDGLMWTRLLPPSAYRFSDQAPGEPAAAAVFPHSLDVPIRTSRTSPRYVGIWDETPFTDAYLGNLATSLVSQMKLGRQAAPDLLAVSFSALDHVGHRYGPKSHEVQDTLARLDVVVGELLDTLDRTVGRDRYVLALSADHGVADLPEQAPAGANAGRFAAAPVAAAVENALDVALGPGRYVNALVNRSLYFAPGVVERVRSRPAVVTAVEHAALGVRGMGHVYWKWDLASKTPTTDPVLARMRLSYMAGRSGDLAIVTLPNWISGTGGNHGSPYDYDRQVPLVFFGQLVKPGRYDAPVSPVDIAPTLAHVVGITLGRTDGRVLSDVLP